MRLKGKWEGEKKSTTELLDCSWTTSKQKRRQRDEIEIVDRYEEVSFAVIIPVALSKLHVCFQRIDWLNNSK